MDVMIHNWLPFCAFFATSPNTMKLTRCRKSAFSTAKMQFRCSAYNLSILGIWLACLSAILAQYAEANNRRGYNLTLQIL